MVRTVDLRTPHLLVSAVLLLGARAVHAQADAGTAAPPPATATPDGGAAPAAPAAPSDAPTETGGGLFEQSQAAAAAPANAGPEAAAAKPPFTLNGYARGDLFAGKVPGQNAAEMKAASHRGEVRRHLARTPALAFSNRAFRGYVGRLRATTQQIDQREATDARTGAMSVRPARRGLAHAA